MKTKLTFSLIIGVGLALAGTTFALADNGPHGGYTALTDACAGCHRAHTAAASRLLVQNVPQLCYSCHGNTGAGADTNVVDGIYLERDSVAEAPPEGVANRGLKGGGFASALMDTDYDGLAAPLSVSSNHLADGSAGTAWGNGAIGSGAGALNFALSCVSCHDPHGGGAYRILRPVPTNSGAGAPVTVLDEGNKTYTVISTTNDYMGENYGSRALPLAAWCSQCHSRYLASTGSGHTDSTDPIFRYRHTTTSVTCVRCHVAHGTTAVMGTYSGAVPWPDSSSTPNGNARSSLLRMDNRGVCAYCHVQSDGTVSGGACDACHGAPPATGAHLQHTGSGAVGYGLTGSFASATNYQYGCGECHPTDLSQHQDGVVQVVLSSTGAPVGSLKAQNSSGASFSGGACGGVYCHSGIQVTSGPVGPMLIDGSGNYILDSHYNPTYAPYTVDETRVFQNTPPWNGGAINSCTACHAFPLTTNFPAVQAGVGNSHQWIDDYGYGNLHAYNMSFDPLPCRTCHYGEITQANSGTRDGMDVTTYAPVPLASRIAHANGQRDVVFDTVDPVIYNTSTGPVQYSLAGAAYRPAEKACTNAACHKLQNYVQWGKPYRWWTNECDLCHRYSGLFPPPPPVSAPGIAKVNIHSTPAARQQPCVSCHAKPHGGGK